MFRFFLNTMQTPDHRLWTGFIFAGLVSILVGFLIIMVPEILIAFIATLFFLAGTGLLIWGWTIRKAQNRSDHITIHIND